MALQTAIEASDWLVLVGVLVGGGVGILAGVVTSVVNYHLEKKKVERERTTLLMKLGAQSAMLKSKDGNIVMAELMEMGMVVPDKDAEDDVRIHPDALVGILELSVERKKRKEEPRVSSS